MNVADPRRTACLEYESGCRKCQLFPQKQSAQAAHFLLVPQNSNARAAVMKWLDDTETVYHDWGAALSLPHGEARLTENTVVLLDGLPEMTRKDVKGVFFRGEPNEGARLLTAFAQAEPLSKLLARAEHDWVRDALADNWLFSLFHPIVYAETGELFAHEALIRARHPQTKEILGAGQIIDAAMSLGLDHVLDQQARRTAIHQAAALPQMTGRLFINFMPNTIYDPEICLRTTMEAAQENGMELSRLVFEVVETEHIPDMKRLQTILDYYRSRGVGTAVDDMGAGFSSLRYLTMLQPDFVKLDRELVVRAEFHSESRHTLDMIVTQAKMLGIKIIAEGIETESQMALCRNAGADFLQGYLFGRPANPPVVSRIPFAARFAAA